MGRHSIWVVAVLAMLAAACTGGATPKPTPTTTPHRSGEAVFGAEQWPECLSPVTECAASPWTHYTVLQHVLPRAMQLDADGNLVASPTLVEAPTLDNGGLAQNPFTVRFRIDPRAIWDDGSPITSRDFKFTWLAVLNTHRGRHHAYRFHEYSHVVSIDATDPHVAVLRFKDVYTGWPELFGGMHEYVLKGSAFSGVDPKKPNLFNEMGDSIRFSGGPFRLESWGRDQAVLVRNDRYYGAPAVLDRVTFLPTLEQNLAAGWLRTGKVLAIYPTSSFGDLNFGQAFGGDARVRTRAGDGVYFEALWVRHDTPPMDDPAVREALMYAVDRQAVVEKVLRPWNRNATVLNCGFVALPDLGPWCRTRPFARFSYDPARARAILEEDGYDCSDEICTRDGRALRIFYSVLSTNVRRTTAQQTVIGRARAAGFLVEPRNYEPTGFGLPRTTHLADYATGAAADPSASELFGCDEIPSQENDFYGANWIHWCNREADLLMKAADRELDPARRLALMDVIYEIQAEDSVSLPLYAVPAVSAWRADRIAGPIGLFNSSPYGLFFNMNQWYLIR